MLCSCSRRESQFDHSSRLLYHFFLAIRSFFRIYFYFFRFISYFSCYRTSRTNSRKSLWAFLLYFTLSTSLQCPGKAYRNDLPNIFPFRDSRAFDVAPNEQVWKISSSFYSLQDLHFIRLSLGNEILVWSRKIFPSSISIYEIRAAMRVNRNLSSHEVK